MAHLTAPQPPKSLATLRAALGGYLRARGRDLWGSSATRRLGWKGIERIMDDFDNRPAPRQAPAAAPTTWAEAVARARLTAADLRQRYEADAPLARALLSAAVVSGLIAVHRGWLADAAGTGASLGMAFTLAGLALAPAYRCWRIRARALGAWRWFLRHPAAWWPYPLPDDDPP